MPLPSNRKINSFLIPAKANRVLHLILIGLCIIALRIWHLTVIQHESRVEASQKPQHKTVYAPAKRGTIHDTFGIPLAINKVQHNVAVVYSQIKQIPARQHQRKDYIKSLSAMLAQELDMDPNRIEDLIHAKASFYNQIPFVLKENISEKQYYRLRMKEKEWLGVQVQTAPKRHYPQGNVASDILGYIGPINREEYDAVIGEIKTIENALKSIRAGLEDSLPEGLYDEEQLEKRHSELMELAYSMNDIIGKSGIEAQYEKGLRGYRGKKHYFTNAKGQYLKELSGNKEPTSGEGLVLTLSAELQEYAEKLLIQNENFRQTRLAHLGTNKRSVVAEKQPWIKGGAIIAMNPNTGEVYAMASHPHYNSNDFIPGGEPKKHLLQWLESDAYIASIWDGQMSLEKEIWTKEEHLKTDTTHLTWDHYLEFILDKDSAVIHTLRTRNTIEDAIRAQNAFNELLQIDEHIHAYSLMNILYPDIEPAKNTKKLLAADYEILHNTLQERSKDITDNEKILQPYIGLLNRVYDQVLLIDLYRVAVDPKLFSDSLMEYVGKQTLATYKEASEALTTIKAVVKNSAQEIFHAHDFKKWREENEKSFLKSKREQEKLNKQYAKPYIDYLDAEEKRQFNIFWQENSIQLISTFLQGNVEDKENVYLTYLDNWHQEIQQRAHQKAFWANHYQLLSGILNKIPFPLDAEYLHTLREYRQLNRPLIGSYKSLRKTKNGQTEKDLAAAFYPKYGYGYARSSSYRQSATQGSIFKLVTSYAALIQQYNALKALPATYASLNPLNMIDTVFTKGKDLYVGFDSDDKPIPRYYKGGRLPKSSMSSIGRVDILKALETSSNPYFSLIAGDILKSPEDLTNAARALSLGRKTGIDLPGEISGNIPTDLDTNRTGLYSLAIGQHTLVVTPLQTAVMLSALANGGKVLKPKIVAQNTYVHRHLFLPDEVKKILLTGMCRVVARSHQESLKSLAKMYKDAPDAISDYVDMKYYLAGKTSTAESVETVDLDPIRGTNIYTHVWFGGILYEKPIFEEPQHRFVFKDNAGAPELVVVVYLRYGGFGKEAAPIAAQVAKKWREIKNNYENL